MCGGLASDPAAVPILIGLGVRELSVVPTLVPQLKSLIRTLTLRCLPRARAARARARHRPKRCARSSTTFSALGIAGGVMKNLVASLQPIGRALMLPIAVLPVAALLLRLGQPDLLNIAAMAAAGNAIFSNLGSAVRDRCRRRSRARESRRCRARERRRLSRRDQGRGSADSQCRPKSPPI